MQKSEYIIWRAETREQIKEEHPDWNNSQVTKYLNAVEDILIKKGMIVKEES